MFPKIIRILFVLLLAATASFGAGASPEAALLVSEMGNAGLTQAQRDAAAGSLVKLGKEAMPTLIGSLHDNRIYFPNYAMSNGTNGPPVTVNVTVGTECNSILMDIVSNGESAKVMDFRYKVFNWPVWWSKHKDMSEGDIQKEVKKHNWFIMESTGQGDSIPHINQP